MNAPAVQIDGHENVPKNNEYALMKAVANHPVSVVDWICNSTKKYISSSFQDTVHDY